MQFVLLEYLPASLNSKFRVRTLEAPSQKALERHVSCEKATSCKAYQVWPAEKWASVLSEGCSLIDLSSIPSDALPLVEEETRYILYSEQDPHSDSQHFASVMLSLEEEESDGYMDPIGGSSLQPIQFVPRNDDLSALLDYYTTEFSELFSDDIMDRVLTLFRPSAFEPFFGLSAATTDSPLGVEEIPPCLPSELLPKLKAWALVSQL
jgi:hypothetical protein